MVLRSGQVFGKVNTCKTCGKQFKYVVPSKRYSSTSTCTVCKPCFDSAKVNQNRDYTYKYEGYLWEYNDEVQE